MKAFSFPLDRVLKYRRLQADQQRAMLERLVTEEKAVFGCHEAIERERSAFDAQLARGIHFDSQDVVTLSDWRVHTKARLAQTAADYREALSKVERQHAVLREAERAVRLLERLKDAKRSAWLEEVDQHQEAFAAEAYLARCIRLKIAGRTGA